MTAPTITQPEVREVTLTHYDGSQRTVMVTDKETPFPTGRLVISHTDINGIITQVNRFLTEISGYTEAEMLGQPHCMLRHPDMPAAIFKDLWETIQKGRIWEGGVKNLRKDGGFYWVDATVTPNTRRGKIIGYISVRNELSRPKREECEKRYPTLFEST